MKSDLRGRRGAFSLVELAIVSVILAVMVIAYFGLSRQETISTRILQDRAKASALAHNMLCLIRNEKNRAWLDDAGTPADDGSFTFPANTITLSEHAFGPSLMEWVDSRKVETEIKWYPDTGEGEDSRLGKVICSISWSHDARTRKTMEVPGVLER